MGANVADCRVTDDSAVKELDLLAFVGQHIKEARRKKATGKLTIELELQDGGVTSKWVGTRFREK